MKLLSNIIWEQPNRMDTAPLHIGTSGRRISSLTGVAWLNEDEFVTNHRSGLRLGLFNFTQQQPLHIAPIRHLTDDVAIKSVGEGNYEVIVSGCWNIPYSVYKLNKISGFWFSHTKDRGCLSFCHGCEFDQNGQIWLGWHTGKNPRIEFIGDTNIKWSLPSPWGCRSICFDESNAYAIAVSNVPQLESYRESKTSVWRLSNALQKPQIRSTQRWEKIIEIDDMHCDSGKVYKGHIWLPDQLNDQVVEVNLETGMMTRVIKDDLICFPHGIDITKTGRLAVCNYGTSNVAVYQI